MGQLEMASALRSMAAAAGISANSGHSAPRADSAHSVDVSPSPASTCSSPVPPNRPPISSPQPQGEDEGEQPLNLTTKKGFFGPMRDMPPLTKIENGRNFLNVIKEDPKPAVVAERSKSKLHSNSSRVVGSDPGSNPTWGTYGRNNMVANAPATIVVPLFPFIESLSCRTL